MSLAGRGERRSSRGEATSGATEPGAPAGDDEHPCARPAETAGTLAGEDESEERLDERAQRLFARHGGSTRTRRLLVVLQEADQPQAREVALEALVLCEDPATVPALLSVWSDDREPRALRIVALRGLAGLAHPAVIPVAFEEDDQELQRIAQCGLARALRRDPRNEGVRQAVSRVATSSRDLAARAEAEEALAVLAIPEEAD